MFDFIRNLFPHKVNSIKEFVKVLKKEGCKQVAVEPYSTHSNGGKTTIGFIGDFQYALEFTATTPRGRKVVYRELLFDRFGSEYGFADADDRRDAAIKMFLLGEQKAKKLQAKLPGLSVNLIASGQPMDRVMFTKLHRDARACGVSI